MGHAIPVEQLIEISFAKLPRDQLAQAIFGSTYPCGQFGHLQVGLAVNLQAFQLVSQQRRQPRIVFACG